LNIWQFVIAIINIFFANLFKRFYLCHIILSKSKNHAFRISNSRPIRNYAELDTLIEIDKIDLRWKTVQ